MFAFLDNSNAIIVFRGTDGDAEWEDNAIGMLLPETQCQIEAYEYVKLVDESFNPLTITLVGHSKGGNKSQYCYIESDKPKIVKVFSIDGQGFSFDFIKHYSEQIKMKAPELISVAERRDFVNCLGFYIKKPVFYTGFRDTALPYYHCQNSLLTAGGKQRDIAYSAYFSTVINRFIVYYLMQNYPPSDKTKVFVHLILLVIVRMVKR